MSTSKTGKHGHAKVHLVATDIFTGKKYEDLSPSTHNMDVPNVSRTEFQLINIDDGYLNLMNTDGTEKNDVRVPESELGEQIETAFNDGQDVRHSLYLSLWFCVLNPVHEQVTVTILAAMGEEHCVAHKAQNA